MKLQPVQNVTETSYPDRKATTFNVLGRWVRRIGSAVAASACIWIVGATTIGCAGMETAGPEFFVCSDDVDISTETMDYPGSYWGSTCSAGGAEGSLEIDERVTLTFNLESGNPDFSLDAVAFIYNASGELMSEVEASGPEVVLTLEPELYDIVVIDENPNGTYSFALHIDQSH